MGRARVVAPPFLLFPLPSVESKRGGECPPLPPSPSFSSSAFFPRKKGDPTSRATEEEEEMGQGAPGWNDGQRRRR